MAVIPPRAHHQIGQRVSIEPPLKSYDSRAQLRRLTCPLFATP